MDGPGRGVRRPPPAPRDRPEAISALERAIETLKASKSTNPETYLVQVKGMVQKALLTADALDIATDKKVVTALLAQPTDDGSRGVAHQDYEFKSGDIISTLEGLLGTFREKKSSLEADNAQAQSDFDIAAQGKTAQIKAAQVPRAALQPASFAAGQLCSPVHRWWGLVLTAALQRRSHHCPDGPGEGIDVTP